MEELYLIGKNISHSASPALYNALFEHLGLPWHYSLADIPTEEEALAFLKTSNWLAVNATMPYKPLAVQMADVLAASVQLSGGANFLFRKQGQLVALNTDGIGCVRYLQHCGYSFNDAHVVVCGTGPTALAIVAAVAAAGAARITLLGRNRERTKATMDAFLERYKQLAYATVELQPMHEDERSFRAAYAQPHYAFGTYETSTAEIAKANIIIDATSLGMAEGDPAPFATELLGGQTLVFDVVYGHGTSALLAAASEAGVAGLDGQGMLLGQAVENAFTLCDTQDVNVELSWSETFSFMARAAGFAQVGGAR